MNPDAGRPYPIALLRLIVYLPGYLVFKRMAHDPPVDQIVGMQYGQGRNTGKRRGCHIKIIPYPYNIRVGIISMQYRIFIGAIAIVGNPYR